MTEVTVFDQWCIVELFGHQRYAGRIRQAEWPPGFARLEIPATEGYEAVTQLLSPQAIYRLTPTSEEIATRVAASCRPEPVHRWELPAAPAVSPVIGYDIGGKLYDPADVTIVRRDDRSIEEMDLGDEPSPWDGVPL